MTVTPRYQAYLDAYNTGVKVPLQLPANKSSKDQPASNDNGQRSRPCTSANPELPAAAQQTWAYLYRCHQGGVDRVFVDHPLFLHHPGQHSKVSINTYLSGPEVPDLDLQYSILCQAALAAPVLLWHQPAEHLHRLQHEACQRTVPQTLSGGLAQYIGQDQLLASVPSERELRDRSTRQRCIDKTSTKQNKDTSCWTADSSIANASEVFSNKPFGTHQGAIPDQRNQARKPDTHDIIWPVTAGSIAYVGNDWPCFPLTQRLAHLQSLFASPCPQEQPGGTFGNAQASSDLACALANSFEGHLARLLKSARVAFCIHSLAHQGIFPEVRFCSSNAFSMIHACFMAQE